MIQCGLVSVTFRTLSCAKIIQLAAASDLAGIEWGGDVHVPAGDFLKAKATAERTAAAGLSVCAYGSYYRVGTYGENGCAVFQKALDTAVCLGAPVIRVWAGDTGSAQTSPEKRRQIVSECRRIADMAGAKNITVALECHRGTLTDDCDSAVCLMRETARDNLRMYWQPNETRDFKYNFRALQTLLPYLVHAHVFHWPDTVRREPLANACAEWTRYLSVIAQDSETHWCCLEFMPDNAPDSLPTEAKTLAELVRRASRLTQ